MPDDQLFAVFVDDHDASLLCGLYADLQEAKGKAQQLADRESLPFFVFGFTEEVKQLRRFEPRTKKAASGAGE